MVHQVREIQTSMRATLGANPVKSEWRLHHQAIPGGECRGMWPDRYSDSRPAPSDVMGIMKLLLSAAEPNTLQTIGGFVATESLFFASSGPD